MLLILKLRKFGATSALRESCRAQNIGSDSGENTTFNSPPTSSNLPNQTSVTLPKSSSRRSLSLELPPGSVLFQSRQTRLPEQQP